MYKFLVLSVLIILSYTKGYSQNHAVAVNIGLLTDGYGGLINYNYFIGEHKYFELGVLYSETVPNYFTNEIRVDSELVALNIGYSTNALISADESINLNVDWHAIIGNELINNTNGTTINNLIIEDKSALIFGLGIGLEAEAQVYKNCSITLKATKYFYYNSNLAGTIGFLGLGLKYYIL